MSFRRPHHRTHPCTTGHASGLFSARLLFSVLLLLPSTAAAQSGAASGTDPAVTARSSVDWEKGTLTLDLSVNVPDGGRNAPAAAYRSQQIADRDIARYLSQAILPIRIDSLHTAGDLVKSTPGLYESFSSAVSGTKQGYPVYSPDLTRVTIPYTAALFPTIGSLFIHHTVPTPINRTLRWVPTNKFTGLVIYAKGTLPVHGTDHTAALVPCLFPDIFDSNMRTVVEKLQMDPSYLKRWGPVAYTQSFSEKQFIDRIGLSPLRIVATGLFGEVPTDPIISPEDADRLLSTENNRKLLEQGRILIIYGAQEQAAPAVTD
ncbi:hypothetical protein [Salinispira pacifica]